VTSAVTSSVPCFRVLLFRGGTRWNLSLHAPTVTAPISSTSGARVARFFSLYFPAFAAHSIFHCTVKSLPGWHLQLQRGIGVRERRMGPRQGKGGTFKASVAGRRASHAWTGLGPAPSHMPYIYARTRLLPASPLCREWVQRLRWGCSKVRTPIPLGYVGFYIVYYWILDDIHRNTIMEVWCG
jgi:hypothetical protein